MLFSINTRTKIASSSKEVKPQRVYIVLLNSTSSPIFNILEYGFGDIIHRTLSCLSAKASDFQHLQKETYRYKTVTNQDCQFCILILLYTNEDIHPETKAQKYLEGSKNKPGLTS